MLPVRLSCRCGPQAGNETQTVQIQKLKAKYDSYTESYDKGYNDEAKAARYKEKACCAPKVVHPCSL